MKMTKKAAWFIIILCLTTLAWANDQNYDKRFSRISYVDGNVVFRHATEPDWIAGSINTPLQEQDRIYLPLNSRGEIEFDDGSYLRIAEDTELTVLQLDRNLIRLELPIGLATLRLRSGVNFQIDTPAGTIQALQEGSYRIEVLRDGAAEVAVRKGTAELMRATGTVRVRRNEALSAPADLSLQAAYRPIDREDAWDSWCDLRDAAAVASYSRRYLPGDVYLGVSDLDHYGTWVNVSSYGNCWRPMHVSIGWSPYREGRWIYRPYWGWTWVSYEPWGWLPYHYGRWFHDPVYSWCWRPDSGFGLSLSFNFWSPGVVHFYRHGGGLHWMPVGPRDHYGANNFYYNVQNVTYNSTVQNYNIRNVPSPRDRQFQNRDIAGALVSERVEAFQHGRPAERFVIPASEVTTRGTLLSSLRDANIQPGAMSNSPRPDVDVRRLGVQDTSSERDAGGGASRLRPSVRTVIPRAGVEIPGGSAADRSMDRPAGRRSLGEYSAPKPGVRTIPAQQDPNPTAGRTTPSAVGRDRDAVSSTYTEEPGGSRRVAPIVSPEAGASSTVRRRLPQREGADGTTPAPSQPVPQDQRRIVPQTGAADTTAPAQERGNQRRFITRDSPDTGALPLGGSRDRDREISSAPAPPPGVRVITPERRAPQSAAPAMNNPAPRRDEPAQDRGSRSTGPTGGSGMPARDRGSVGSGPAPAAPPAMRAPTERRTIEKKPDPPGN